VNAALLLAVMAAAPSTEITVPALPGFTCATRKVKTDALDMTETRCTQSVKQGSPVVVEARLYTAITASPPEVNVLCKADLKRNHSMVFDAFESAAATVVTLRDLPACRVDITGTHGTTGGPWRLVETTIPMKNRWLALTAQGPVSAMLAQQATVERFLAETAAK